MSEKAERPSATTPGESGALLGGGLFWRSRAAACAPGTACARPAIRRVTTLTLFLAGILGYAVA